MEMDLSTLTEPPGLYILIAVAVLVVALLIWAAVAAGRRKREREELRKRYGSEYDRTVQQHRRKRDAVADLRQREEQHESIQLRDLNDADLQLVRRHMAIAQYRFVEEPADALRQTERVLTEVLRAKGYPMGTDPDQATRLFSVDHPEHAGTVRSMLSGGGHSDVDTMRDQFLQARKTIAEVTGASFVLDDAAAQPGDDLRVERSVDEPASAS